MTDVAGSPAPKAKRPVMPTTTLGMWALVLAVLGVAWFFATVAAWFFIMFTGRHPEELYRFGVAVLRFNTYVEGYLLLLHDELPPFALQTT